MKTPDSTVAAAILAGGTVDVPAVTPGDVKVDGLKVSRPLTDRDMTRKPLYDEVGPLLDSVADRYLGQDTTAILVDSKAVFGGWTIMPGFHAMKTGARGHKKFEGITA